MKKSIKITLFTLGLLGCIWIIGSVSGMLRRFSSPANANYPTIKTDDGFFTSNLKKPERFDFICYYATTPEFGRHIRVHRVCGVEGDKIEIRNGDLFVNNKPADGDLPLAHVYTFQFYESEKISEVLTLDEMFTQYISADSMMSYLPVQTVKKRAWKVRRVIIPADEKNEPISLQWAKPWNQDNFGPVVVPHNKFFLLGDNRSYSDDSRYIGFIDKSDYVATVLGK
jgi:signal peptidase I